VLLPLCVLLGTAPATLRTGLAELYKRVKRESIERHAAVLQHYITLTVILSDNRPSQVDFKHIGWAARAPCLSRRALSQSRRALSRRALYV
jgi:hypothetical protein